MSAGTRSWTSSSGEPKAPRRVLNSCGFRRSVTAWRGRSGTTRLELRCCGAHGPERYGFPTPCWRRLPHRCSTGHAYMSSKLPVSHAGQQQHQQHHAERRHLNPNLLQFSSAARVHVVTTLVVAKYEQACSSMLHSTLFVYSFCLEVGTGSASSARPCACR